ncbi:hypothetical protein M7I_1534 [Glarea lozoyensis 74030]|uniref:Uncharacterized protein n=1 Tax=Glarea lozoyensis (strain ATCC 74030 / MF5533) TaxID=1104152 RepID=H0EGB9_GLAL7|nr:hypothetical protein M7I_1534 [Glarea lozoyensis 74030]
MVQVIPKHAEIIQATRIRRGIVGHEQPEENKDYVLEAEGKKVYAAPRSVLSKNAREKSGEKHSKKEA